MRAKYQPQGRKLIGETVISASSAELWGLLRLSLRRALPKSSTT